MGKFTLTLDADEMRVLLAMLSMATALYTHLDTKDFATLDRAGKAVFDRLGEKFKEMADAGIDLK